MHSSIDIILLFKFHFQINNNNYKVLGDIVDACLLDTIFYDGSNKEGLSVTYKVENRDNKEMPFGFALHPYFTKLSGENGTFISVPVGSVDLDDVYNGFLPGKNSYIDYTTLKLRLNLLYTPDFTHTVAYTPKNKPYFCIEPQTCSTNGAMQTGWIKDNSGSWY
ncbi:hypothetical protein [Clostridium sp.]|uniref:hypothetical protein n=1 Tax=Clostridium sp. TaxID=1506 RepID=UPI00260745FA|nr:hypothetical protein [Clostridium sp.]